MNANSTELPASSVAFIETDCPLNAKKVDCVSMAAPALVDPWILRTGVKDLFPAKEEPIQGKLAKELASLNIKDLKILSAEGSMALYSRDQADVPDLLRAFLFESTPDTVVQPFNADAVAAILKHASSKGIPVIVRGAGSSPFGGSMPVRGGIVLDMNAMDRVLDLNEATGSVNVQAGMRWADLDFFLEGHGLSVRSCPSSRFSTVGGWVATGGIGIDSLSGGHLSRSVLELEVVTPDGRIRRLRPGDADFKAMFGSEGRLAVVTTIKLQAKSRVAMPAPRLVLFKEHDQALRYAVSLSSSVQRPIDLAYYSPAKFRALNRILGKEHFPEAHGVIACFDGQQRQEAAHTISVPIGATVAQPYLAHLLWNERYFPMKFRKLGPGMMGSEVLAPKTALHQIVAKALEVCDQHALEPMIEIHFLEGGDGLLLCYYITNQTRTLKYTMDSFRGLLITSALLEVGAMPYSTGVWNNAFSDRVPKEGAKGLAETKSNLDPQGIMNRGKYPRLGGRLGGLPATLFSPGVLGAGLRLMNLVGPASSRAVAMISSGRAFDRIDDDLLTRTADECAMCGACVGVCPAYLATKDERVTGRGKLLTARDLSHGKEISKEHAHRTFLCMRCKACEQVCQSKLNLIPVYEELERRLAQSHGKDDEEIARFVKQVELSPAYDALVERGLVLGAPSRDLKGGA